MLTDAERQFPQRYARTGRFSNGAPRSVTVSPDGKRVVFLRSSGPEDPGNALWVYDLDGMRERLVADPDSLDDANADLPAVERARRERVRESAGGVVTYACDDAVRVATFAVGGTLFLADLVDGGARSLPSERGVFDPRPDPTGERVAYVSGGDLHVVEIEGGVDRILAADPDPDVSWGVAEFAAAEEMDRIRGFWWSPDGEHVAACRVDDRPVTVWHLADPTDPEAEPRAMRYPVAGSPNADVTLAIFEAASGSRAPVQWDREAFPYLARVAWPSTAPMTLLVQSRDQRTTQVLEVDATSGQTTVVREDRDEHWVELLLGSPARTSDGRLVGTIDADDTRRLAIDGEVVTPPGLQVRSVVRAGDDVLITASPDPREIHVYRVPLDGGEPEKLTSTPGVHGATAGGDTLAVLSRTLDEDLPRIEVRAGGSRVRQLTSLAEGAPVETRPSFFVSGSREVRSALLVPRGAQPERIGPLPVLLDPYGGPHHARVLHSRVDFHVSQWFADRGFAVLVTDGRGTPGRGCSWERAIHGDLATPVLEDQIDALHAAAERHPGVLDLERVAIRGWSFGGFLAALAVLERPDVVHAAVAGAPVTDWAMYDTHYTERYLGMPQDEPEAYARSNLLARAERLERPLLLIHGLADDNVVVAHTLLFATRLFEAGRHHELTLLPNATHMTRSEVAVERRFDLELDFLRRALSLDEQERS